MDSETLRLLQRIKNTADGKDLINFIVGLSNNNYKAWKAEGGDVLRGKALALDQLVEFFETCDTKLVPKEAPAEWL
jgi:hypothetical protein